MDYLSIDLASAPLRAMRSTVADGKFSVIRVAEGPAQATLQSAWIDSWIKSEQRFFRPTQLLVTCTSPDLSVHIRPADAQTRQPVISQQDDAPAAAETLTIHCALPPLHRQDPLPSIVLNMDVGLPKHHIDSLLENCTRFHNHCRKISIVPVSLWAAFMATYPDYRDKSAAVVWNTATQLIIVIIDRGRLTYCRYFRGQIADTAGTAAQIKESIEQWSFLFPSSVLDMIFIGGHIPDMAMLSDWTLNLTDCLCEPLVMYRSGHGQFFDEKSTMHTLPALAPYWPCMGLVWELCYPWETLYG